MILNGELCRSYKEALCAPITLLMLHWQATVVRVGGFTQAQLTFIVLSKAVHELNLRSHNYAFVRLRSPLISFLLCFFSTDRMPS